MESMMRMLEGKQIIISQNGDAGGKGRLVNTQRDYASIWNEKQLTHYPYGHIKSVTTDVTERAVSVPLPDVAFPDTFEGLLEALLKKKVRIETGEGAREGVLSTLADNTVSLVVNVKELTIYPIGQIKNIAPYFAIKSDKTAQSSSAGGDGGGNGGGNSGGDGGGQKGQDGGNKGSSNQNGKDSSSSGGIDKGSSSSSNHEKGDSSSRRETSGETQSRSSSEGATGASDSESRFNKSLAISMLDRLNESYYAGQRRNKTLYSSQEKSRTAVSISAPMPSFIKKSCSVSQNRAFR